MQPEQGQVKGQAVRSGPMSWRGLVNTSVHRGCVTLGPAPTASPRVRAGPPSFWRPKASEVTACHRPGRGGRGTGHCRTTPGSLGEPQASTLRPACGSHLHIRVEALLPLFLPVALGVEEQLVGACLHLARRQEPRTAAVRVSVAEVGDGGGDEMPPLPGSAHPAASDAPAAWLGTDVRVWGSGAAQGPCCTVLLGNHRRKGASHEQ